MPDKYITTCWWAEIGSQSYKTHVLKPPMKGNGSSPAGFEKTLHLENRIGGRICKYDHPHNVMFQYTFNIYRYIQYTVYLT